MAQVFEIPFDATKFRALIDESLGLEDLDEHDELIISHDELKDKAFVAQLISLVRTTININPIVTRFQLRLFVTGRRHGTFIDVTSTTETDKPISRLLIHFGTVENMTMTRATTEEELYVVIPNGHLLMLDKERCETHQVTLKSDTKYVLGAPGTKGPLKMRARQPRYLFDIIFFAPQADQVPTMMMGEGPRGDD